MILYSQEGNNIKNGCLIFPLIDQILYNQKQHYKVLLSEQWCICTSQVVI